MGAEPSERDRPHPGGGPDQPSRDRQAYHVNTDRVRLRLQHNAAIAVLGGVFLALCWCGVVAVTSVVRHPSVLVLVVALCAATAALAVVVVRGRRRLRPFYRMREPLLVIDPTGLQVAGSATMPWSQVLGLLLVTAAESSGSPRAGIDLVRWSRQLADAESALLLTLGVRDLPRYLDERNRPLMRLVDRRSDCLLVLDLDALLGTEDAEQVVAGLQAAAGDAGVGFRQLPAGPRAIEARRRVAAGIPLESRR